MSQVKGLKELELPVRQPRNGADMNDISRPLFGMIFISAFNFKNEMGQTENVDKQPS